MAPRYANGSCDGKCGALRTTEWLALKSAFSVDASGKSMTVVADKTFLKKSELLSGSLPGLEKRAAAHGEMFKLVTRAAAIDGRYWLVDLAPSMQGV